MDHSMAASHGGMCGRGGDRLKTVWLAVLLSFLLLLLAGCARSSGSPTISGHSPPPTSAPGSPVPTGSASVSNGQRIYLYATSASGSGITYTGGPGMMMQAPLSCATCHGPDGRGGQVTFMMQTFDVPNITWTVLSGPDPDMEHPPYTVNTLKQAIVEGTDPGGSALNYPMPRWQMSPQDLNDLVAFIMTLK